ncbi:predicted protein [Postia placenta Mad-698-R]|nr:predicted protein [Postia placenta Mad-698-R]
MTFLARFLLRIVIKSEERLLMPTGSRRVDHSRPEHPLSNYWNFGSRLSCVQFLVATRQTMIKAGKWGRWQKRDGDRGARKQFQSVVLQAVISQEAINRCFLLAEHRQIALRKADAKVVHVGSKMPSDQLSNRIAAAHTYGPFASSMLGIPDFQKRKRFNIPDILLEVVVPTPGRHLIEAAGRDISDAADSPGTTDIVGEYTENEGIKATQCLSMWMYFTPLAENRHARPRNTSGS